MTNLTDEKIQTERQAMFDYVVEKLAKQGKRSVARRYENTFDNGIYTSIQCQYRGNGNTRCAFGWLISDDEYEAAMEYKRASEVIEMYHLDRFVPHIAFITEMQVIHDTACHIPGTHEFTNVWQIHGIAIRFERLAIEYHLSASKVYEVWPK